MRVIRAGPGGAGPVIGRGGSCASEAQVGPADVGPCVERGEGPWQQGIRIHDKVRVERKVSLKRVTLHRQRVFSTQRQRESRQRDSEGRDHGDRWGQRQRQSKALRGAPGCSVYRSFL